MNTTTLQYLLDHLAQDSILILELSRTIFFIFVLNDILSSCEIWQIRITGLSL